jgi:predicted DNA binding protein
MCRQETPIDWERVDEMLEAGCYGTEIAAYFGIHPETFYDRVAKAHNIAFSEYAARKKSKGDTAIKEAQFKKAIKKLDNTMLIWLGKNRLNQRENAQEKIAPDDVLKAFEQLMIQINEAQARKAEESSESKPDLKPETINSVFSS